MVQKKIIIWKHGILFYSKIRIRINYNYQMKKKGVGVLFESLCIHINVRDTNTFYINTIYKP